ncbi:MAG: antitoxin [Kineosporiaceae bacterium]
MPDCTEASAMAGMDDLVNRAKDLADKAQDLAKDNPEQVEGAVDKIGGLVDKATGGRFGDQVDTIGDTVVDRLTDGPDRKGS